MSRLNPGIQYQNRRAGADVMSGINQLLSGLNYGGGASGMFGIAPPPGYGAGQVNGLFDAYQSALDHHHQQNEDRYAEGHGERSGLRDRSMGRVASLGRQARDDINERADINRANQHANLVSRGLTASTVGMAGDALTERERNSEMRRLDDMLTRQQLDVDRATTNDLVGFVERRNDLPPDFNQLASLAQGLGQFGGSGMFGGVQRPTYNSAGPVAGSGMAGGFGGIQRPTYSSAGPVAGSGPSAGAPTKPGPGSSPMSGIVNALRPQGPSGNLSSAYESALMNQYGQAAMNPQQQLQQQFGLQDMALQQQMGQFYRPGAGTIANARIANKLVNGPSRPYSQMVAEARARRGSRVKPMTQAEKNQAGIDRRRAAGAMDPGDIMQMNNSNTFNLPAGVPANMMGMVDAGSMYKVPAAAYGYAPQMGGSGGMAMPQGGPAQQQQGGPAQQQGGSANPGFGALMSGLGGLAQSFLNFMQGGSGNKRPTQLAGRPSPSYGNGGIPFPG